MRAYVLQLNDMRSPKVEHLVPVARASTAQALAMFLEREMVEPYSDGRWGKCFRKDGLLEWFNPPSAGFDIVEADAEASGRELTESINRRLQEIPEVIL